MMLYVVRHGDAVSEQVDIERPLSEEGARQAQALAAFLKKSSPVIPLFVHSTKKRAQQTAEIFHRTINPQGRLEMREGICPDDPTDLMVREVGELSLNMMIVGHLPYVARFVSQLTDGHENGPSLGFKTGSVAVLERNEKHKWQLKSFLDPSVILRPQAEESHLKKDSSLRSE